MTNTGLPWARRAAVAVALLALSPLPARAAGKKPGSPASDASGASSTPLRDRAGTEPLPVILSEAASVNDFVLFANGGGWDGNWYVGHNTCWISRLPPAPPGVYKRAFLGAKLGRMKTESVPGRPSWEKRPVPGEVDIAVAPEPRWPQSRRALLARTDDIPLEGDSENAVEGVGESRWFWVEVPVGSISTKGDNYVALFSPSPGLADARSAPILAAAWGDTRQNTWLSSNAKGEPPFSGYEALKTTVTYFEPAIAIKLVPPSARTVEVALVSPPAPRTVLSDKVALSAAVRGENVEAAWIEFSTDSRVWRPLSPSLRGAPYDFTVRRKDLPEGPVRLRAAAKDAWENRGASEPITVVVPPPPSGKK